MSLLWQQVSAAKGTENRGGIASVKVPTDPQQDPKQCIDWTTIDDSPEVIAAISDRLKKQFGQSKNCTWTSPPLDFTMHFEGTGDIAVYPYRYL